MEILKYISGKKGNSGIVRSDGLKKKKYELRDGKNVTKQCSVLDLPLGLVVFFIIIIISFNTICLHPKRAACILY